MPRHIPPMTLRLIDKLARDTPTVEGGQSISNLFFFFGVKHPLHRLQVQPLFSVAQSLAHHV